MGSIVNSWSDRTSVNYQLILHGGDHLIGLHGQDSSGVISGAMVTLEIGGQVITSTGVSPDETDITPWRYDPSPMVTGKLGWCSLEFDDSSWQPAIRAFEWGNNPWLQNPNDQ